MSWLMKISDMPSAFTSRSISATISAWTIVSRALVGSSAISSFGSGGNRRGDGDALALAAGKLVRVGGARAWPGRAGGRGPISSTALSWAAPAIEAEMCPDDLGDLRADAHDRVEAGAGILEHEADVAAADRLRGRGRANRSRPEICAVLGKQAGDRQRQRRSCPSRFRRSPPAARPSPRSRLMPSSAAASPCRRDSERRGRGSVRRGVTTVLAWPLPPRPRLRRRDRRRARQAPARCRGRSTGTGAERSTVRPSAIMPPQVTRLGSPSPRKERAASVRIATGDDDRRLRQHRRQRVGQDLAERDLQRAHADDAGRRDIVAFADRQHFGARNAGRAGPGRQRNGDHHDAERGADDADEGQRQQEAGHGLERIGDAHQHLVGDAADEAGQRADDRADGDRGCRRGERDGQRRARAVHDAGQHVAAEPVGAKRQRPVLERRLAAPGRRSTSGSCGNRAGAASASAARASRMMAPAAPSGVRRKRRGEAHAASPLPMRGSSKA